MTSEPKQPAISLETMGLPESLGGEAFREHWLYHLQARKDWKHKRYTPRGAAMKLDGWTKFPVQAVIDAIHESAEQGYQGTFPEKHAAKYRNHASGTGSQVDIWLAANRDAERPPEQPPLRGLPCT